MVSYLHLAVLSSSRSLNSPFNFGQLTSGYLISLFSVLLATLMLVSVPLLEVPLFQVILIPNIVSCFFSSIDEVIINLIVRQFKGDSVLYLHT